MKKSKFIVISNPLVADVSLFEWYKKALKSDGVRAIYIKTANGTFEKQESLDVSKPLGVVWDES